MAAMLVGDSGWRMADKWVDRWVVSLVAEKVDWMAAMMVAWRDETKAVCWVDLRAASMEALTVGPSANAMVELWADRTDFEMAEKLAYRQVGAWVAKMETMLVDEMVDCMVVHSAC